MSGVSALMFDFNGTLSNDEPVLCRIFQELFRERGRPLAERRYYDELAGLSDEAIVTTWLGEDYPDLRGAVSERIARYRNLVADGSTIDERTREAVRFAAARVPVAVVSGAARVEIDPVLEATALAPLFTAVVCSDTVVQGKPHPESYLTALALLGVAAGDAVAFEDTEAGIAAATDAGLRCIAVRGTLSPARLARAEELVDGIDRDLIERLLATR
jgi:beta-phosphoglucomutase